MSELLDSIRIRFLWLFYEVGPILVVLLFLVAVAAILYSIVVP
jgi:hypothetical protein